MPRCPTCKKQLERIAYERVGVYNCGSCGGNWLDEMRLDVILERREEVLPEAVRERMLEIAEESNTKKRLWCLPCGVEMRKEHFKYWTHIEIDRCPKCDGLWFDRGELEKCQIYWEYLQDNPETFKEVEVMGKQALIEAELLERKAAGRSMREDAARRPAREGIVQRATWPLAGILTRLLGD